MTSGLLSKRSITLSAESGNFKSLSELCTCIKASMLLPGITGDVVRIKVSDGGREGHGERGGVQYRKLHVVGIEGWMEYETLSSRTYGGYT